MPLLNGCPFKMEKIVQVHIGDVAAGITVASLQSEGTESIIYGTLMGKKGKKKKKDNISRRERVIEGGGG